MKTEHRRLQGSLTTAWRLLAALVLLLALAGAALAAKPMVSANNHDTFVLNADGSVQVTGYNNYGMLGNDTTADVHGFTAPSGFSDVIQVAAGYYHSAVLKADGKVWVTGRNTYGQVGDNDTLNLTEVHVPTQTPNFTDVKQVAVGGYHTLALKADGTVYAWGFGGDGQLGNNSLAQKHAPYPVVSTLTGIKQIGAGWRFSAALKSDGTVWTWGKNDFGQLGDSSVAVGSYSSTPVPVSGLTGVKQISVGYYHVLALKADGTVVSWGYNASGQLGDNKNSGEYSNAPVAVSGLTGVLIKKVAAGGWHSLALRDNGALKSWGYNSYYQLGDGSATNRNTPVDVTVTGADGVVDVAGGSGHTAFLRANGQVYTFGGNQNGELGDGSYGGWSSTSLNPTDVNPATGVAIVQVAGESSDSLALGSDGSVWAWGWNIYGEFGNGSTANSLSPVFNSNISNVISISGGGQFQTYVLKSDGSVWAFGYNASGQLGNGSDDEYSSIPVPVSDLSHVIHISGGFGHGLALKSDGTVWSWGANGNGQLGNGTTTPSKTPIQVTNLPETIAIAAGAYHSLALAKDGSVYAWGNNLFGRLGDNSTFDRPTPVPVPGFSGILQLGAGESHSLAVKDNGTAWAWGLNNHGQLGDNSTDIRLTPTPVSNISDVVQLTGNHLSSMALVSNGSVLGWGYNYFGTLGNGSVDESHTPVPASNLSGVTNLGGGGAHTISAKANGTVYTWGHNYYGQLGYGTAPAYWSSTPLPVSF